MSIRGKRKELRHEALAAWDNIHIAFPECNMPSKNLMNNG
jgi:hypothetical protein